VPTGKCLSVQEGVFNGNALIFTGCDASPEQTWNFDGESLKSGSDAGKCVDAPNGDLTEATELEVWDCNGSDGQSYGYDDSENTIYASASSSDATLCFDVQNSGTEDVNVVWLWTCYGGDNQKFRYNQLLVA